jgi:hypothetical protein
MSSWHRRLRYAPSPRRDHDPGDDDGDPHELDRREGDARSAGDQERQRPCGDAQNPAERAPVTISRTMIAAAMSRYQTKIE